MYAFVLIICTHLPRAEPYASVLDVALHTYVPSPLWLVISWNPSEVDLNTSLAPSSCGPLLGVFQVWLQERQSMNFSFGITSLLKLNVSSLQQPMVTIKENKSVVVIKFFL